METRDNSIEGKNTKLYRKLKFDREKAVGFHPNNRNSRLHVNRINENQ